MSLPRPSQAPEHRALLNHEYLLQYIDPKSQGQLYFLDLLETSTCLPQDSLPGAVLRTGPFSGITFSKQTEREKENISKKETFKLAL